MFFVGFVKGLLYWFPMGFLNSQFLAQVAGQYKEVVGKTIQIGQHTVSTKLCDRKSAAIRSALRHTVRAT